MAFEIKMQSTEQDFNVGFDSEEKAFGVKFANTQMVSTGDHAMLSNRDAPEQHPIKAISNLQNELNVRSSEALTNTDIMAIISM